jgi:glycosyltransferase involved in cell wall biosynthesis
VKQPDFTIITPSFGQLDHLACCIASVADQEGVEVEHIVQDGGTKGFADFAKRMAQQWPNRNGYQRIMVSEQDGGMYDAINRGLKRAKGKVCAYLNCDEQYLPGVLPMIWASFQKNPSVDVVLGDVIIVGKDGEPVCHRKMVKPGLAHTWTCHFGALTAGIFFREKLVNEGLLFDTSYRVASDAEWFVRVLQSGKKVQPLRRTTSTFMESGENLGLSSAAKEERERLDASAPLYFRVLRPVWVLMHRLRRLWTGAHRSEDVAYGIYLPKQSARKVFTAKRLRTTWPGRIFNF